jgi:DNA polymerase-3 subunit epsilon
MHAGAQADAPRRQRMEPLPIRITDAELAAHAAFVATLGDRPLWNEFAGA